MYKQIFKHGGFLFGTFYKSYFKTLLPIIFTTTLQESYGILIYQGLKRPIMQTKYSDRTEGCFVGTIGRRKFIISEKVILDHFIARFFTHKNFADWPTDRYFS